MPALNPLFDAFGEDYYRYNQLTSGSFDTYANQIRADQERVWAREDSAYQRMVSDMTKAGLNPWTGISSGGLSTAGGNPSSDILKGLIQGLEYNKSVSDSVRKSDEKFMDQVIDILGIFGRFAGSFMSAVNS